MGYILAMAKPRTGSMRYRAGAWRLQVSNGYDLDGCRRYVNATCHAPDTKPGRSTAHAALARLVLEVDAGHHARPDRGSVAELIDRWIDARSADWAPLAAKHTRQVLARHVLPTLGTTPVTDLTPLDIQDLYRRLRRDLSPATVRRIHSYLSSALTQAVRWELLNHNPAARVQPPRIPARPEHRIPNAFAVRAAIEQAPDANVRTLLRLAVHTGARRGELVALRWVDVDVDAGIIRFAQTKTNTYKTLAVGKRTVEVLYGHRDVIDAQAAALGVKAPAWVFPSWRRYGQPIRADYVSRSWAKLRDAVGLDSVRLHDLRHTTATHLIGDHDVTTVQRRGGWANPSVLLGVYSHRVDARDRAAAEAMDDWLDS